MNYYATLDCAILTRIEESACTFTSINANVNHLAKPYATPNRYTDTSFRVVDRRLQALRKRGLIEFRKGLWYSAGASKDRSSR